MALPESVREVVERRVTALGDRARETLTAAAVIGRNFDLGLLAKLVEIGETELLDELEQAVAASLLAESTEKVGRFSFAHALISHTHYDGLGATRRARMHLQVAEALEDLYGTDSEEQFAELALHWRLATVSVDKAKAARYSLRAGQRALDNLAPEHARRWALAEEAIALARQVGDPRTLATVLEDSCYAIWAPDTLAKRAELVRELMAVVVQVKDLHVEYFARLRETNIAMELCDFARADAALERIQAIAEQTRQPTRRWNTGFIAAAVCCMRGELEAGERLAEQALQIGQEGGEPDAAMAYGATLIMNRMYQGRGAEVVALLEQTVANVPGVAAWEAALGLTYCFIDRRPDGAEVLVRAAGQHFEHLRHDQFRMCGLALYADTAARTGSVEAAAMLYELLDPYADQFVWTGATGFGHARMYLALLAATLGRHERADAHFAFACAFHHQHSLRVWEARSELGWAEALADRGETERAREHAARALELAREHGYGAFEPGAAAILTSHASSSGGR